MTPSAPWREAYRQRRVLLLGATGFIGRRLLRELLALQATVSATVRPGALAPVLPGTTVFPVDLAAAEAVEDLVARANPDITFNLAGYGVDPSEVDADLAGRLNTALVAELASACAQVPPGSWPGQRLVHAGSAAEYGAIGGDLAEESVESPVGTYGHTKLAGTRALTAAMQASGLRGVTARLFTVYGPGEPAGRLLPTLLSAVGRRDPIALTAGNQRRDFTAVDDVVEGLLRLGAAPGEIGPVINLATGRLESVRGFVERAATVLGLAPGRLRFGALPTRPDEMAHEPVRLARLVATIGWQPGIAIEEGVRRARDEWPGDLTPD